MRMETTEEIGLHRLASRLGLTMWQMRLAREHGLLPEPDRDGRWSAQLAEECRDRVPQVLHAFGEQAPVGAAKAAARLAQRLRLDVEKADIEMLVARGDLTVIGTFRRNPLYLLRDLDALDAGTVAEVVAARKGPLLDRVDTKGAARMLGWSQAIFTRVASERGLPADQLGRYAVEDVRALTDDADLAERIRSAQRDQAMDQARRTEQRHRTRLHDWMLSCTAFLEGATEEPPDTATAARSLRAIAAARHTLSSDKT